jgi:hypothetical protein
MFRRLLLISLLVAGCAPNNATPVETGAIPPSASATPIADAVSSLPPASPARSVAAPSSPPPSDASTPAQSGSPSPAASAPAASPVASAAGPTTFANGTYLVRTDIRPGTYRTREPSKGCSWTRFNGFNSTDVAVNEVTDAVTIVTISPKDVAFKAEDCGTWTSDLSRVTSSRRSFGPGTFIVRVDVAPGRYRASGGSSCYWARLQDFSGDGVIASDQVGGRPIVTIEPTDKGFKSEGCGTWSRA